MPDNQLSLYFQLKPNQRANLEVVASAALAWVGTLRAASQALDLESDLRIELVDADESSLILNTIVDWVERHVERKIERVEAGGGKLPRTKKLAIALAIFLIFTGVPTYDFYFGDEGFSDQERAELKALMDQAEADKEVRKARQTFFRAVEQEPAIAAVGVKEHPDDAKPIIMVPSDRFAEAGGLWSAEQEETVEERITRPELEVVLVKPALVHTPRAWTFRVENVGEFDATMKDPIVLEAMRGSGLPEQLREGIAMKVRLEVKEVLGGSEWRLVRGGRSVTKVISPTFD